MNKQISTVQNCMRIATQDVGFDTLLTGIQSGRWKASIDPARAAYKAGNLAEYDRMKRALPAAMISGRFTRREANNLTEHSGLVVCDLDHLGDRLPEVRAKMDGDQHTVCSFISPSGDGLKFVCQVEPTPTDKHTHKAAFEAVRAHYEAAHGVELDPSGKDVSRLCFVSYDPALFRRDQSEPIKWDASAPERSETPPPPHATSSRAPTAHRAAYVQAAIDGELSNVRAAPRGTRNDTLNKASHAVGQFVGAGAITRADAESELMAAAQAAGLPDHEARITIKSGLDAGEREPRKIPEPAAQTPSTQQESRLAPHTAGGTPEAWPEPIPFGAPVEPPSFPTDCLPEPMRAYVQDLAECLQVPPDLPGQLVFGAFATAAAKKYRVQIGEAFSEPLNDFFLTAMPPGSRKSPTFSTVFRPLEEFQARQSSAAAASIARASERRKIEEARLAEIRKQAAREKDPTNREALTKEAENLAANMTVIPAPPRILAMDVPPEKLSSLCCENEGRIALYDSEGGALFDMICGKYGAANAGPNVEFYLRAHAGDPIQTDRMGRISEGTDSAALTLVLTCQPSVLRDLGDKKALRGRGLLARFLYSMPAGCVGNRMFQNRPPNKDLANSFEQRITRLLEVEPGERFLRINRDALAVWEGGANAIERDQAPGGPLEGMTDFASKLAGHVARLAGLLHLMAGHTDFKAIDADTVRAALVFGGYYLETTKQVFGMLTAGTRTEFAQKILHWIMATRRESFTLSDVFRNFQNSAAITEANDLRPGLECLTERNFIRELDPPTGRGRKPAARFETNPALWGEK